MAVPAVLTRPYDKLDIGVAREMIRIARTDLKAELPLFMKGVYHVVGVGFKFTVGEPVDVIGGGPPVAMRAPVESCDMETLEDLEAECKKITPDMIAAACTASVPAGAEAGLRDWKPDPERMKRLFEFFATFILPMLLKGGGA